MPRPSRPNDIVTKGSHWDRPQESKSIFTQTFSGVFWGRRDEGTGVCIAKDKFGILLIEQALTLMNLQPTFSAIDLACGVGSVLQYLHNKFPLAHLLGIDLLEEFADPLLNKGIAFQRREIIDYITTDGQDIPFDLLIMTGTYRGSMPKNDRDTLHTWLKKNVTYFLTDFDSGLTPQLRFLKLGSFKQPYSAGTFDFLLWKTGEDYEGMDYSVIGPEKTS